MTFLGDYSASRGRWFGGSGLAALLVTGLIGGYSFDSENNLEENPPAIVSENERVRALVELSEIYNRGVGFEGGNLIRESPGETVEAIVSSWSSLPKEERYDVLSSLVKCQLREVGYDLRDLTRDNLGEAMFFLIGSGF